MSEEDRVLKIMALLEKAYPDAKIMLNYTNPLELLVATILSAQCTDKRVNIVTQELFKRYKSARDYANADLSVLEQDVKSTGFYRNKAKNIKRCCQILVEKYDSQVPKTMDELLELPGVARKTANIVWQVRENVRNALNQPPLKFNNMEETLAYVSTRFDIGLKTWINNSKLLRDSLRQMKLTDYF